MPIVFDEVSAEIAPPPAGGPSDGAAALQPPPADAAAADAVEQVRRALALLHERTARSLAD